MNTIGFLSVQILVKDSEDNIKRCLDSLLCLRQYIKDVVIVNDDSKDKTVEIVNTYKDIFCIAIYHTKKDHRGFAGLRNDAIGICKGDWVLVLDSDETIHQDMFWEILPMVQSEQILAYFFPRVLLFPDSANYITNAYPDYQMRLFRKLPGVRFTREVHEYLEFVDKDGKIFSLGINQPNTKITHKIHIYHFQLLSSEEKLKEKGRRWMEQSKASKQAGFEIVGEDAYVFNQYQHQFSPLPNDLVLGMEVKRTEWDILNKIREKIDAEVQFDEKGQATSNINTREYWNELFKEHELSDSAINGQLPIINFGCKDAAQFYKKFIDDYAKIPVKKILEIGCGTKTEALELHKMGYDMTVIDISDYMIQKQKENCNGPKYLQMDARTLGFSDSEFDFIYSSDVLEHFPETEETIKEWLRCLKPGGHMLITTVGPDHEKLATHCKLFTKESLTKELGLDGDGLKYHVSVIKCGDYENMGRGDRNITFWIHKAINK